MLIIDGFAGGGGASTGIENALGRSPDFAVNHAVVSGKAKPWRSAAEIIDWSIPCPSIFDSAAEIKQKHGPRAVRPLLAISVKGLTASRRIPKTTWNGEPLWLSVIMFPHQCLTISCPASKNEALSN